MRRSYGFVLNAAQQLHKEVNFVGNVANYTFSLDGQNYENLLILQHEKIEAKFQTILNIPLYEVIGGICCQYSFFSFGGLIAYFVLKMMIHQKQKNCLIIGACLSGESLSVYLSAYLLQTPFYI